MAPITITYHRENAAWWAESDELVGFSALAGEFAEVRRMVAEHIEAVSLDTPVQVVERLDDGALIAPSFARTSSSSGFGTAWSPAARSARPVFEQRLGLISA